jgi:hypothetical protein
MPSRKPINGNDSGCLAKLRSVLKPMQLDQIDRQQGDVKTEHRIDVSEQAIANEQDVARDGEHPKREYRRHAKACQHRKGCAKAKAIDPEHRLFASRGQPGFSRPLFKRRNTAGE